MTTSRKKRKKKKTKTKRISLSVRLKPETLKDLEKLRVIRGYKTKSQTLRFLMQTGFSNLGNWRNS